jgi:nucleoside-diphosphate-sugar epimerase
VVGGTGFIGGHLSEYLFAEGEISKGIFRKGSHLKIMDQCGIQCIEADLTDRHTLHEPLDMVDVVFNLASPPPGRAREEYLTFNDVGLRNLLEEAHEHGAKSFVHLSTLDVYGFGSGSSIGRDTVPRPTDEYQKSKLEGERVVTEFSKSHPEMKVHIVRAARAVGSRDPSIVIPILKMIERGGVTLPSGSSSGLSVTHPKDIAQALVKAAASQGDATPIQIKSFELKVDELARALLKAAGKTAEVKQQGVFSGKSLIGKYAGDGIKSGLILEEKDSSIRIAYSPKFDLDGLVGEVAAWYRKEPWVTQDLG